MPFPAGIPEPSLPLLQGLCTLLIPCILALIPRGSAQKGGRP